MTVKYGVFGSKTDQCYGVYQNRAEAFRLGINEKFSRPVDNPNEFDKTRKQSQLTFTEPVFVARLDHSVESQRPYTGLDTRVREINELEDWEKANRVRKVLG